MIKTLPKWKGFYHSKKVVFIFIDRNCLIISYLCVCWLLVAYRLEQADYKFKYIMLTIVLFLALLILCWVVYKSIDWFEKI